MTVKKHAAQVLLANEGAFISGGELAARLGVSRSAVWKAVQSLQQDGYHIESVTGRGYCLLSGDVLSKDGIERRLSTQGLSITVYPSVTSTNRLAKECGERGEPEGTVIVAAAQTEGRGRLGRSFCSPADTGLYMSVLLRPTLPVQKALLITTAAAVAVCRAIERESPQIAQIKWVNDVFCRGKKVCGILTEASLDTETGGLGYAVLGIGINVRDPQGGFPEEIADIAASVFGETGGDRCRLAAAVLDEFFAEYAHIEEERFVDDYRQRSMLPGRSILVKSPHGDCAATAVDVDEQCRLRVRYDDGTQEYLSSGDVSIRI